MPVLIADWPWAQQRAGIARAIRERCSTSRRDPGAAPARRANRAQRVHSAEAHGPRSTAGTGGIFGFSLGDGHSIRRNRCIVLAVRWSSPAAAVTPPAVAPLFSWAVLPLAGSCSAGCSPSSRWKAATGSALLGSSRGHLAMIVRSIVGVPVIDAVRNIRSQHRVPRRASSFRLVDQIAVERHWMSGDRTRGASPVWRMPVFTDLPLSFGRPSGTLSWLFGEWRTSSASRPPRVHGHGLAENLRTSSRSWRCCRSATGGMLYTLNPGYMMILFRRSEASKMFFQLRGGYSPDEMHFASAIIRQSLHDGSAARAEIGNGRSRNYAPPAGLFLLMVTMQPICRDCGRAGRYKLPGRRSSETAGSLSVKWNRSCAKTRWPTRGCRH